MTLPSKSLTVAILAALLGFSGLGAVPRASAAAPVDTSETGRERRLLDTYRSVLADDPTQEYAFRRLLEVAHAVGGLSGLIKLYQEQVAAEPKNFGAHLVLAALKREADDFDGARQAFQKAAELKPERAEPHLMRAALERERRAFAAAFEAYDRAIALFQRRGEKQPLQDAITAAGECAIEARDGAHARAYFEKLVQSEPHNVFLRMQEATTYARLDQPEKALERWLEVEKRAQGQLNHLVVAWKETAILQEQLGQMREAEATWRRGLERLPRGHYERRTFLDGLIGLFRAEDRLPALARELEPEAARDADLLTVLAHIYEELADDAKALALYREAAQRRPNDEEARMAALRILERSGSPEEVLKAWEEIVRAFPGEPRHVLKLAELQFHYGNAKEGQGLLTRISRQFPGDPSVHLQIVDLWLRYGDPKSRGAVEAEYKLLMRLEPDEDSHVVSLGEYYWSTDDQTRAVATWKRLLQMGHGPGEGEFLLAEVYADHGRLNDALALLQAALQKAPESERFMRAQALAYEKMNRPADALVLWQRLARATPGQAAGAGGGRTSPLVREAREHIVSLWEKAERLETEIDQLAKRFAETPPDLAAGRFLGVSLVKLGRVAEARVVLERLEQLTPDDIEILSALGDVYARSNEPRRAMEVLERLAHVSPIGAVEFLHRAADLALSIGDEAAALRMARQVVELNPADPAAHTRVGELYQRMGREADAAEAWRQALALDQRNVAVRFKLAALYRDQDNALREEQILAEIVRDASDPADLLRAGRRLIQLAVASGRLDEAEAFMRPLADRGRQRATMLKLLVELYGQLASARSLAAGTPQARRQALEALGERALRPLIDAVEDSDVGVRDEALEVLALTHPSAAVPALARLAQNPDSMAQVPAIAALGGIGTSGAVTALGQLLQSPLSQTRELATWALGSVARPDALALLVDRMHRGSPRDRLLCAVAIGRAQYPAAVGGGAVALAALTELLRDRSADVREAALWALGRNATPEAIPLLAERLAQASNAREAELAAWGLGQVATPAAFDALVKALWAGQPGVGARDDAIWEALAGPESASQAAVEAIYDALASRARGVILPVRGTLFALDTAENQGVGGDGLLAKHRERITARLDAILGGTSASTKLALARNLLRGRVGLAFLPPGRFPRDHAANRVTTEALLAALEARLVAQLGPEVPLDVRDAYFRVFARHAPGRALPMALLALVPPPGARGVDGVPLGALEVVAASPEAPASALAPWAEAGRRVLLGAESRALVGYGLARAAANDAATLAFLADRDPSVRAATARGLGQRQELGAAVVARLLELARDAVPEPALAAVVALRTRPDLLGRLAEKGPPGVRAAARAALTAPR